MKIPSCGCFERRFAAKTTVMDEAGENDQEANDDDHDGVADDVARCRCESKPTR